MTFLPFSARRPPPAQPTHDSTVQLLVAAAVLVLTIIAHFFLRPKHPKKRETNHTGSQTKKKKAATQNDKLANLVQTSLNSKEYSKCINLLPKLVEEYRYVEAGDLLLALRSSQPPLTQAQRSKLDRLLAPQGALATLEERYLELTKALQLFNGDKQGWDVSQMGADTVVAARMRPLSSSLQLIDVKIDATLHNIDPADTLMIWREVGLYHKWFPFCSASSLLGPFVHAAEIVGHMVFEVALYGVMDVVIRGFGGNNPRDGNMQLCVRPLSQRDTNIELPPKPEGKGKIFKLGRVHVVIDVLIEPISADSVRFCYSMTQPIPTAAPSWIVKMVLKRGMGTIFREMQKVALDMSRGKPDCPLVQHISRADYLPIAKWLRERAAAYG